MLCRGNPGKTAGLRSYPSRLPRWCRRERPGRSRGTCLPMQGRRPARMHGRPRKTCMKPGRGLPRKRSARPRKRPARRRNSRSDTSASTCASAPPAVTGTSLCKWWKAWDACSHGQWRANARNREQAAFPEHQEQRGTARVSAMILFLLLILLLATAWGRGRPLSGYRPGPAAPRAARDQAGGAAASGKGGSAAGTGRDAPRDDAAPPPDDAAATPPPPPPPPAAPGSDPAEQPDGRPSASST